MVRIASLVLASAAAVSGAAIEARQDAQPVLVQNFSYEGDGCPEGSVTLGNVDIVKGNVELFYKDLVAKIEPKGPKVNKKCQLKIDFNTTAQRQIVVMGGDYKGHVKLEAGVYAKQQNQYKFDGSPGISNMQWEFRDPIDAATVFTNVLNATLVSPCGQPGAQFGLIINNFLTLTSDPENGGAGEISVAELDAGVRQSLQIQSQDCPAA